jgi:PAS domain S-box-containing protein
MGDAARAGRRSFESGDHAQVTRAERQLAAAEQITQTGSWEWDARTSELSWSAELFRIYGLEPHAREVTFELFLSMLHPDDRPRVQAEVSAALARGGRFHYIERIVRPDGAIRQLDTIGEVVVDAGGAPVGLIGTCRDVTDERVREAAMQRALRLQQGEHALLERIASEVPLDDLLVDVAALVEQNAPGTFAMIVLSDAAGARIRSVLGPGVSPELRAFLETTKAVDERGPSMVAIREGRPVYVHADENSPGWGSSRALATGNGVRSVWATPVLGIDGHGLGSFTLMSREARLPREDEIELLARAKHLARIAIERRALEDQLRALSAHVVSVREEERASLARDLHDELGQSLTALKLDLAWVARRLAELEVPAPVGVLDKLEDLGARADDLLEHARRISSGLRPGVLDDLGLYAALEWEAHEFTRRTGVACELVSTLADVKFPRAVSTTAFRIAQEALTNVARHAAAKHVTLTVREEGRWLHVTVEDDGRGIAAEALRSRSSLGLLGVRERARALAGTAEIGARRGGGTYVRLALPLGGPG